LLDLSNCQLHALEKLQQRTLPRTALYVHTAFMHDALDHLCWKSGNTIDKRRVTQVCCQLCITTCRDAFMATTAGYASWLASASPVLLHMAFCSHATYKYLILLHNDFSS